MCDFETFLNHIFFFRIYSGPTKIKRKKKETKDPLNLGNLSMSKTKNANSSKDVTIRDNISQFSK